MQLRTCSLVTPNFWHRYARARSAQSLVPPVLRWNTGFEPSAAA